MKNQHSGWLCVVSRKSLNNKFKLLCTTEDPDSLIQRQNEIHQYPAYMPYALEYKTYVTDLHAIIKRIHETTGTSERNVWFDCPLSEITQIIEKELHTTSTEPRDEDKKAQEAYHEIWSYNPFMRMPRGSDMCKIENIKKHFEITQRAKVLRKWKRKIEAEQGGPNGKTGI